jgi:hypothetical protein
VRRFPSAPTTPTSPTTPAALAARDGEPSPFGRAAVDLVRLRRELDGLRDETERPSSVRVGRRVA